jgi:hypothetical protein
MGRAFGYFFAAADDAGQARYVLSHFEIVLSTAKGER